MEKPFRFRPYSKRSQKYIYEQNQQEILRLKTNGDRLLQIIQTWVNQREYNLYYFKQITENILRIISLIETYRYFQAKNELITRENYTWFYQIAACYYLDTVENFNKRLKNLNNNNDIDFVIVK